MSRYGLVLLPLMLFAPQIHSQLRPRDQDFAQRVAAERETVVSNGPDVARERMEHELIARAIAERQAKLRQDTEKLLALAAELKQNVDKTGPNVLSLEVIKKAQEIEKLAKSVKEKMKDAY